MKWIAIIALAFLPMFAGAQTYNLQGQVTDSESAPIIYATVSLLQPADSTLAFFAITNEQGAFSVQGITNGTYLMQISYMGFMTHYRKMQFPLQGGANIGRITLKYLPTTLKEVQVTAEKVPLRIKGDTLEYNASAFRTKPDASVEDLLKKLPGVEVDRSGNIKAQGESVQKVLVDGKEFFSDDPKVATKNLPADAIKNIQVFNKKSDATEFTGIDDGMRDKTINLQLKDGKKVGVFGDVQAGGGTDERYKFSGKLYKFRPKSQLAAMGMFNNINQFGFSFQDYLSFSGGLRSLMDGGGSMRFNLENANAMPIDFGQPITGLIKSGAGGLNYSYEPRKNQRYTISYMGSGTNKGLDQQTQTQYSIPADYDTDEQQRQQSENWMHKLNLSVRKDVDSSSQLTVYGSAGLTKGSELTNRQVASKVRDAVLNKLDSRTDEHTSGISANGRASYLVQTDSKWPVIKLLADATYSRSLSKADWNNITYLLDSNRMLADMQFQDNQTENLRYSGTASVVRSLGKSYYLEPQVNAGIDGQSLNRTQGLANTDVSIDSLSTDFIRYYKWLRPGVGLKRSKEKTQFNATVNVEAGYMSNNKAGVASSVKNYTYLLPSAMWQHQYSQGKRLMAQYNSEVSAPDARLMLTLPNNANPLELYLGNDKLKPEYTHNVNLNWIWFDQFSFTSLFANIGGRYTKDKINTGRYVGNNLVQIIQPVNVDYNYDMHGGAEFSRPIRKLGLNMDIELNERFEKGLSPINATDNSTTTFNHQLTLTLGNRKKEKIDVQVGGSINVSDVKYSISKSFNNRFYNYSAFSEISYRPTDHWYFMASADITQYNAQSFDGAVIIPLLKAEASYYFLKGNRGVLTLDGFDLLNKNQSLQRISQLNFLQQTSANIIGRYFMLSFKYRLSKTGSSSPNSGGLDIKVKSK
jgi:hypothetical protein